MNTEELNSAIERVKLGDEKSFEKIYDCYSSTLYGITLKILNNQELAEDALQEGFIKIWKNIHSFDEKKGSFFTWMMNIIRNTSIDKYRQLTKTSYLQNQNGEANVSNSEQFSSTININHIGIKELLITLPQDQQEIIDYLFFKGYTQQELADELNIPIGTVKTKSRTAITSLRELFMLLLGWI